MAKHKENKDTRNDFISETAQFFLKPFKLIGKLLEELVHAVSTLIFRIAYGKDYEKVILQKEAMKDALEVAKERQKEEQLKEKAKEPTLLEKFKDRLNPDKTITKEQSIEICKEKLGNQSLNDVFKDTEKLEIFKENFDNYLDETFLKDQTREYDLKLDKNNNILIYKMDKETKNNKELILGINKNEIFCRYNDNLTKDDIKIYKAMLNFCKETNIKPEPTADEIKQTLETEIEKMKKNTSKNINIRGKEFFIEKGDLNSITISHVDALKNKEVIFKTSPEFTVKEDSLHLINYAVVASKCRPLINEEIIKQVEKFSNMEKEQQAKDFYKDLTLKQSIDHIKEKYDLHTMDINIFENKIIIYKEENELRNKAFLSTDLNGVPYQSNEYFKELKDIQKDLSCIQEKFKNATLKDIFENTKEETGCVMINEQIYSFKQIPNSYLYELHDVSGEKVMTYDAKSHNLEHHIKQEENEYTKEIEKKDR